MFYAIFTKNMGLGWPILHQSWVQIDFVDLENNLDDLQVNKTCLWHQEAAKYIKMQRNWVLRVQNHVLYYFFRNMELRCTILHQSFVQISFVGFENNLNALYANNACFWHQEVAKIRHNARWPILHFMLFLFKQLKSYFSLLTIR